MPRRSKKDKDTGTINAPCISTPIHTNVKELPQLPSLLSDIKTTPKKKQTKKNFIVVASVGPNGIQGSLVPETRKPLIAHLQIQTKDIVTLGSTVHYNPNPPPVIEAYNLTEINNFIENPAPFIEEFEENKDAYKHNLIKYENVKVEIDRKKQEQNNINSTSQVTTANLQVLDFYKKDQTLLVQYRNSDDTKTIPEQSDIACMWCCHMFENRPCVIPSRDIGTHLQVYGNFCCPECAMAYLFDQRMDAHSRWEQLSLLNRIYGEMVGGQVFIAPNRGVLKLFGGPYTIEQFRGLIRSHKFRVDIHLPPMVSILATMDTKPIDFYDASISKTVLETAQERVARAEEVLRLKRTKPLKAWESTLDACMNIRTGVVKN